MLGTLDISCAQGHVMSVHPMPLPSYEPMSYEPMSYDFIECLGISHAPGGQLAGPSGGVCG